MEPSASTTAPARARWAGVGRCVRDDARAAGHAAVTAALDGRDDARVVLFFAPMCCDFEALAAGAHEAAAGVPLVGCSTAADEREAVAIALGGDGLAVSTASADASATGLREAGAEVAACLGDVADREHRVLLAVTDGLLDDQEGLVRGAYSVAGAGVPIVGGGAADHFAMNKTFQVHGDAVLRDSVVAAAIGSDAPIGVGLAHGEVPLGEPMIVTRSDGPHVLELDDRPALDVYLERLGAPEGVVDDPDLFRRFVLPHALGVARRNGELRPRGVRGCCPERKTLHCFTSVPQGSLVWLMKGDAAAILDATDAALDEALEALDGATPQVIVLFDCIARREMLGPDGCAEDARRIAARVGDTPFVTVPTYGEIGRTRGLTGFHNHTVVAVAVA